MPFETPEAATSRSVVSGKISCEVVSSRQTLKLRSGSLTFVWKSAINFLDVQIFNGCRKLLELRSRSMGELRKGDAESVPFVAAGTAKVSSRRS